jgi:hypothetical protein
MEDAGWDPAAESKNFVHDLSALIHSDITNVSLADIRLTRWRMAAIAYAHLVEMDAPYNMLANLMRLRVRKRYSVDPFRTEDARRKGPKAKLSGRKPGPREKVPALRELAEQCGMTSIVDAMIAFYIAPLRNAVSHSDFSFHGDELRTRRSYFKDPTGVLAPSIKLDRLGEIIGRALWFYSALFECERHARRAFAGLQGKTFRYDERYKGILEILYDDSLACGVSLHWPNGSTSTWRRTGIGCSCINMIFTNEGALEPMVGLYSSTPGVYSPLVDRNAAPVYSALVDGSSPTWDCAIAPDSLSG